MTNSMSCRHNCVALMGVIIFLIGGLMIWFGIWSNMAESLITKPTETIWAGIVVCITGFVGFAGGRQKSSGTELVFLMLCVGTGVGATQIISQRAWGGYWRDSYYTNNITHLELSDSAKKKCSKKATEKESIVGRRPEQDPEWILCTNNSAMIADLLLLATCELAFVTALSGALAGSCAVLRCCGAGASSVDALDSPRPSLPSRPRTVDIESNADLGEAVHVPRCKDGRGGPETDDPGNLVHVPRSQGSHRVPGRDSVSDLGERGDLPRSKASQRTTVTAATTGQREEDDFAHPGAVPRTADRDRVPDNDAPDEDSEIPPAVHGEVDTEVQEAPEPRPPTPQGVIADDVNGH